MNTSKEYKYRLLIRPFSFGTQPDGFIRHENDGSQFGVVVYTRPLKRKDVENFTLVPLTETKDLEGNRYEIPFGSHTLIFRVINADNGFVRFVIDEERELTFPYYRFINAIAKATLLPREVENII